MDGHQTTMGEPRLFEDFRLSRASEGRRREVGVVTTAFDAVMAGDLTYVSTPITSGAVLYREMDRAGVSTVEELRADKGYFYDNVIRPNIQTADGVARDILGMKGGAVIAPAVFEARQLDWDQDAYMALWLDVIERKATRIAMVDGWEYSNGGAEEYLQALLMQAGRRDRSDIEIVDQRGDPLDQTVALRLLAGAVEDLLGRGFVPVVTATVLSRMVGLWAIVTAESDYGLASDTSGRRSYCPSGAYFLSFGDNARFRTALRECRKAFDAGCALLPE